VEHCLAEARRMAQLAVQESTLTELKHTGDELRRLSATVSSTSIVLCLFIYLLTYLL